MSCTFPITLYKLLQLLFTVYENLYSIFFFLKYKLQDMSNYDILQNALYHIKSELFGVAVRGIELRANQEVQEVGPSNYRRGDQPIRYLSPISSI